jgi:hypothetical protein
MKLNHLVSNEKPPQIIQAFGSAKLVKHANGKHELVGGSSADIADVKDWVGFFAHEIVFGGPVSKSVPQPGRKTKGLVFRFHGRLTQHRQIGIRRETSG